MSCTSGTYIRVHNDTIDWTSMGHMAPFARSVALARKLSHLHNHTSRAPKYWRARTNAGPGYCARSYNREDCNSDPCNARLATRCAMRVHIISVCVGDRTALGWAMRSVGSMRQTCRSALQAQRELITRRSLPSPPVHVKQAGSRWGL